MNEMQEIKRNSLRHDGYIFTLYFLHSGTISRTKYFSKNPELYIFRKALPHRLLESLPNHETLNILRDIADFPLK